MLSAKWQPFCLGHNMSKQLTNKLKLLTKTIRKFGLDFDTKAIFMYKEWSNGVFKYRNEINNDKPSWTKSIYHNIVT